jgi:hypothetical protein
VADAPIGAHRVITATITDHAGLARAAVAYSSGNGLWQVMEMTAGADDKYTAVLPLTDELIYFVQAMDLAANVAVADFKAYYLGPGGGPPPTDIDMIAPVTQLSAQPAEPNGNNGWYTRSVTLTLEATDDLSGVAYSEYQLNDMEWQVYTTQVILSTERETDVAYRSVDLAGNRETVQALTFSLDMTAPDSTAMAPSQVNGSVVTTTWQVTDNLSGVERVVLWYQFAFGDWIESEISGTGSSGTFFFFPPHGFGTYCLATQGIDYAGNQELSPTGAGDVCVNYVAPTAPHYVYLPVIQRP